MPGATPAARNWSAYRARFVEARRIDAGARWWRANDGWLNLADERFGVPADIVVGIVGVETYYGRNTGNFRVLDALATLAFDFQRAQQPQRLLPLRARPVSEACAARSLGPDRRVRLLCRCDGLAAVHAQQLLSYALDFDEDGRIDLVNSSADVVGSVARFLAEHGWQRGMPSHYPIEPPADIIERALLLVPDIVPSFSPAEMTERGARLGEAALQHEGSLALIELQNGDAPPTYVAGTQNFYALTRYNASSYYAMAVIELGRAVAAAR